eukprot:5102395-Prymnesium_polylepis.1
MVVSSSDPRRPPKFKTSTHSRRALDTRVLRPPRGCHLDRHRRSGEAEAIVEGISKVEIRMTGQAETLSG